jgi:signal transduction histidine kinase
MRLRSLRARLTLWYTSLLTVTFVILGGVTYGLLVYSLSHDMDAALRSVGRVLAEENRQGVSRLFPADIDAIFRRFFGVSPWDRYFEMRDPFGHHDPRWQRQHSTQLPLSPQALQNAKAGLPTVETVKSLGRYPVRVLTQPVLERGQVISVLQVGMSLESLYVTRRRFLLIMAGVLPLGLLLAGGGGWLLARRALAPVDRMTEAARRIGAAHLAERLEESGVDDELDRLASTLNAMLGRLDAAFRQIRQFSADASHELQTPLTILKGELEVALRAPRSPEAYQDHLRSALEEVDRIARLVEGLLLLARADAGVLRMDRKAVDLAQLVEEVYQQVKVLADSRDITLDLEAVEPLTIQGDYDRLRRLLLNSVMGPGRRCGFLIPASAFLLRNKSASSSASTALPRPASRARWVPVWGSVSPNPSPRPMVEPCKSTAAPAAAAPLPCFCPSTGPHETRNRGRHTCRLRPDRSAEQRGAHRPIP